MLCMENYDYDVLCSKYDYCRRVSDVCFRDTVFDKVFNDMSLKTFLFGQ